MSCSAQLHVYATISCNQLQQGRERQLLMKP